MNNPVIKTYYEKGLAVKANQWNEKMNKEHQSEIINCFNNTKIYTDKFNNSDNKGKLPESIQVLDTDSVYALSLINLMIKPEDKPIALLNFASYKHPGGMFLKGSTAQEEALCHESILFNVLNKFNSTYYAENRDIVKNIGNVYTNRGLYTPNVLFIHKEEYIYSDVITVASPNRAYSPWSPVRITSEVNYYALKERCKFVLDIAEDNKVKTLILGAFGCGVFKQSPYDVAHFFRDNITSGKYNFKNIIFAIPYGDNYKAFVEVFNDIATGIFIGD